MKKFNRYKKHQELLKNVKFALQQKYPEAKIFDRHVGVFRYLRSNGIIKINKPGMADIWMLYKGNHYEFEIKTNKAKQTKEQKQWEKVVTDCGSYYYVIRSIDDVQSLEL